MSRALSGFAILVGGLALHDAGAQDLRELRARAERQSRLAQNAAVALRDYRLPARLYASASDTIVIAGGHITVLAQREIAKTARAAALQADSALRKVIELVPLIHGAIVHVALDTIGPSYRQHPEPRAVIRFSLPPHAGSAEATGDPDVEIIARSIEGTAFNRILDKHKTPFFEWRRGNLPLRDGDLPPDWASVRFDILESRSLLGPRCYRGDIAACTMMLGFTTVENPIMAWYDSLARFQMLADARPAAIRVNRADTEACERGNDAACGRVLNQTSAAFRAAPAGPVSRDALVWEAIRIGGAGAIKRLVLHTGSPAEAIAAAASVPLDSVVRSWHRQVRGGSLESEDLSGQMVIVSIAWVLLLLGLSTRISRWR